MRWLESNDLGAVLIALIGAMVTLLSGGKIREMISPTKPAPSPDMAEIKGALISDKSAERIVQSSDAFTAAAMMLKTSIDRDVEAKTALTKALMATNASAERMIEANSGNLDVIRANTAAANAVASEAHDLRDRIGELAKELEIQSRLRRSKE